MTNTVQLDLIAENAVNIGATYRTKIQLCNAPDLTLYIGTCQIRQAPASTDIILTATINILSKDLFEMVIPYGIFNTTIQAGNFVYDVLFSKTDDRFYAIGGKIQLVKRVTQIS